MPSKQFPIVFKSVQGLSLPTLEHSWFNEDEIDEIVRTLKELLPPHSTTKCLRRIAQSDIGVVTPYKLQRRMISKKLRHLHFDQVTVGTAEIFQGKEKPIMIISTVRSFGGLGFVADPRVCPEFIVNFILLNSILFFFCCSFHITATQCDHNPCQMFGGDHR